MSWFQICRNLRVFSPPNVPSQNFRVHKKVVFPSLVAAGLSKIQIGCQFKVRINQPNHFLSRKEKKMRGKYVFFFWDKEVGWIIMGVWSTLSSHLQPICLFLQIESQFATFFLITGTSPRSTNLQEICLFLKIDYYVSTLSSVLEWFIWTVLWQAQFK